ncbi:MAG: HYExAFE family protein [Phycisphaerales bacterium]|nr:HYExAFE family protein [Phycisphaerales bacterium]
MAQRRHHYERAFEEYLRTTRIPYVAVNEARKALLPERAALRTTRAGEDPESLKNFDFVIYGDTPNLLVEIKGRKLPPLRLKDGTPGKARLESWVTMDDIESLMRWQELFGSGYEAAFVFIYWCADTPPDGLFGELIEHQGRWYTLRAITLGDYISAMKVRSPRWRTLHLSTADFDRLAAPFAPPSAASAHAGAGESPVFDPFARNTLGDNPARNPVFA